MTNDDGFSSKGIHLLALSLSEIARITVIAPETEMSSCSASLSLRKKLNLKKQRSYGENIAVYSLSGTTGDCCKLALEYWLAKDKPDLIVSGINNGFNTGSDCLYSGTVAGAMEGIFAGIPSLAVSAETTEDVAFLSKAAEFTKEVVETYFVNHHYKGILNLNIPLMKPDKIDGNHIKTAPLGLQHYTNVIIGETDKKEDMEFIMSGKPVGGEKEETDVYWARNGFITITPLQWNQTDIDNLKNVEKIGKTFVD